MVYFQTQNTKIKERKKLRKNERKTKIISFIVVKGSVRFSSVQSIRNSLYTRNISALTKTHTFNSNERSTINDQRRHHFNILSSVRYTWKKKTGPTIGYCSKFLLPRIFSLFISFAVALLYLVMRFGPVYALVIYIMNSTKFNSVFGLIPKLFACVCVCIMKNKKLMHRIVGYFFFSYRKSRNFHTIYFFFPLPAPFALFSKSWIRFSFSFLHSFRIRCSSFASFLFLFMCSACLSFILRVYRVFNVHYPTLRFHGISGPCLKRTLLFNSELITNINSISSQKHRRDERTKVKGMLNFLCYIEEGERKKRE